MIMSCVLTVSKFAGLERSFQIVIRCIALAERLPFGAFQVQVLLGAYMLHLLLRLKVEAA